MLFDKDMIQQVYDQLPDRIGQVRKLFDRPLTLTEKLLYTHLFNNKLPETPYERGGDFVDFAPDRVAMQDATAQMALLQFMMTGKEEVAVPTTVHCDHLIQAFKGAEEDLKNALVSNKEVYDFLSSVSKKYGIGFWEPGAGIIHQIVLENYAFPGGMMIGTDSHTPNAGGLGMLAIGVGGADAVDVMTAMPWEIQMPEIIGVKLTGELSGWTAAKDVILKVADILTVDGGTGSIVEYFGEGADTISCTGKATICNMGAEIGATTSLFGYDNKMADYLRMTNRGPVADAAQEVKQHLRADEEVYNQPGQYYDKVIEIDLSTLEPHVNGPYTPDKAWPVSQLKEAAETHDWPAEIDVSLIGSCTNSSYEDITRAASIADQAIDNKIETKTQFTVTPGSEQIHQTMKRDGLLEKFKDINGTVLANACGPCIGQWKREMENPDRKNTIITSYNRNFAKRNDGNPNTHSFVASPEIVTAYALAGTLKFNPLTDELKTETGEKIKLAPPEGQELPSNGFAAQNADPADLGYEPPASSDQEVEVKVAEESDRIELLEPFDEWDGNDLEGLQLLFKAKGKCTTDHISQAGPWLYYRGHLDNISKNLLLGAVNAFTEEAGKTKNSLTGAYEEPHEVARDYKEKGYASFIVGEENYGEGSSREHAAMEPRHLGVRVVLVKSFARIHETNLKKQGVLAVTFRNNEDYEKVREDDQLAITGLDHFKPGEPLTATLTHQDGTEDTFTVEHSYSKTQIEWFKAGSAINWIRQQQKETAAE